MTVFRYYVGRSKWDFSPSELTRYCTCYVVTRISDTSNLVFLYAEEFLSRVPVHVSPFLDGIPCTFFKLWCVLCCKNALLPFLKNKEEHLLPYNLLSHFSDLVLFELWVHLKISLPSCELSFISVFTSAGYNRTKGLKTFLKPKFGALSSSFYYNNILRFGDALSLIKK